MLELDSVDVMPEILSNESMSPESKEIATNGASKFQFDSIADTVEAFSMISPRHLQSLALGRFFKIAIVINSHHRARPFHYSP